MSIKLTLLKTGETIISDMQELVEDQKQKAPHAYLLNHPHKIITRDKDFLTEEELNNKTYGINVLMTPWIVLSSDKQILIPVDAVLAIVEPIDAIRKMFTEKQEVKKEEKNLNE